MKFQYTIGEIAMLQNVSTKTVSRAIKAGKLEAIFHNKRVLRIPLENYHAWIARLKADAAARAASSNTIRRAA